MRQTFKLDRIIRHNKTKRHGQETNHKTENVCQKTGLKKYHVGHEKEYETKIMRQTMRETILAKRKTKLAKRQTKLAKRQTMMYKRHAMTKHLVDHETDLGTDFEMDRVAYLKTIHYGQTHTMRQTILAKRQTMLAKRQTMLAKRQAMR